MITSKIITNLLSLIYCMLKEDILKHVLLISSQSFKSIHRLINYYFYFFNIIYNIESAATDLSELTDTVTSYISYCEDMCIPTRIFLSFNNDKPWFTGKLKQLRQAKENAYRSGDKILYNQRRNRPTKEIRVAKKNHSEKLKKKIFQQMSCHQYGLD